jgi:hypothetical protein
MPAGNAAGLPAALSIVLAIAAIGVAMAFDFLFTHVIHDPTGYAWGASTAISFGAAGYGSALFTKARGGFLAGVVVGAALLYGAANFATAFTIDDLDISSAIFDGSENILIALLFGFGGVNRGARQKAHRTG